MAESPEEKQALENLDEVTRQVAAGEEDKELVRERRYWSSLGWLRLLGLRRSKLDPPPGAPGLRDALRGDDEKS